MDLDGLCLRFSSLGERGRSGLQNLRFGKRVEVGLLQPHLTIK